MALSSPRQRFGRFCLLLAGISFFVLTLWPTGRRTIFGSPNPQRGWDNLDTITNGTLGFEKIFSINLPTRPDKKDNIILGSAVSDLKVDWIDGVNPEEISPKSYPYNWNFDHEPTEYAARRAHLDAIQRVVEQRLSSAIIMEDDVDWDVSVKNQFHSFALAVRALQYLSVNQIPTHSPYGDDWDVFWLGHCGMECKTQEPYALNSNDPTVPATRHFLPYWRDPPPLERPDDARLTCALKDGVCSNFYAVSRRGAQRILSALSVNPSGLAEEIDIGAQFDVSLGRMCGHGYLRCFSSYPSLTGSFRAAGTAAKSSDIHSEEGDNSDFVSRGVMYSTMLNINRILRGGRAVHSTWDDVEVPIIDSELLSNHGGKTSVIVNEDP
ncbi:hypothetical protein N7509_004911 [Penicillium cosmopolitanum]|uniref:Glycosyltransferase family 25 protein n=1 Tax=Penicillium cosmopolitanum TaxID=1131564 RepID=A0A9X0B9J5_9EURO|nr:uncharacterized protein N7509_004911 [Penicillium cosmopolitanum]KAJ5396798.1 hypothetical protein N7509_004911 [Penicillium cosmopolitanum]